MLAEQHPSEPKRHPASRLVAILAITVGIGAIAFGSVTMLAYFGPRLMNVGGAPFLDRLLSVMLVLIGFPLIASVPGLLCAGCGHRLLQQVTVSTVKDAVGGLTLVTVLACYAAAWFLIPFGTVFQARPGVIGFATIVAVLIAPGVLLYAVAARQILLHDRIPHDGYRDILTPNVLHGWGFFMLFPLFMPIQRYFDVAESGIPMYLLGTALMFAAMAPFICCFGRIVYKVIDRLSPRESSLLTDEGSDS